MRLPILLTTSLFALAPVHANVIWNYSFGSGTETGYFETNGTFADTAGSFNFVIDPATFHVTSSAFAPTLVGLTFTAGNQPDIGFLWNGTAPTQFYRGSGTYTNGANVYSSDTNYRVVFYAGGSTVTGAIAANESPEESGFTTLTITPQEALAGVPEPATFAVAGLGLAGLALLRARRARSTAPHLSDRQATAVAHPESTPEPGGSRQLQRDGSPSTRILRPGVSTEETR